MRHLFKLLMLNVSLIGLGLSTPFVYSEEIEAKLETSATTEVVQQVKSSAIEETVLGMNVSGNKEAPNILYIIPWKDSSDNSTPPEVTRLMDEVFSTVDPDVYEKEVRFYDQLIDGAANTQSKGKE